MFFVAFVIQTYHNKIKAMCYSYKILIFCVCALVKVSIALICNECKGDPGSLSFIVEKLKSKMDSLGIGDENNSSLGLKSLNHFCENLEDLGDPKDCSDGSLCFEIIAKFGIGPFKKEKVFRNCFWPLPIKSSWLEYLIDKSQDSLDNSKICKKISYMKNTFKVSYVLMNRHNSILF